MHFGSYRAQRGSGRWSRPNVSEFQRLRLVARSGRRNSTGELFAGGGARFNFLTDSSGEGCPGALISKEVRALVIFGSGSRDLGSRIKEQLPVLGAIADFVNRLVLRHIQSVRHRGATTPKRLVAVSLVFLLASVSLAGKKKPDPDPVMPDVTARGRALCEYDQAAWQATDAVQALHPPAQSVGRYIVLKSDTGWTVAFGHLNDHRDRFIIGYEATQGATLQEFAVKKLDPPTEDTSFYLAAAKAIDTGRYRTRSILESKLWLP